MDPRVCEDALFFILRRSKVEFVRSEFFHGLGVGEARERLLFDDVSHRFDGPRNHRFDGTHHVFLRYERHFNIYLSVLEAAVRAQVFVAHGARNLEVALETTDHEKLFVLLG